MPRIKEQPPYSNGDIIEYDETTGMGRVSCSNADRKENLILSEPMFLGFNKKLDDEYLNTLLDATAKALAVVDAKHVPNEFGDQHYVSFILHGDPIDSVTKDYLVPALLSLEHVLKKYNDGKVSEMGVDIIYNGSEYRLSIFASLSAFNYVPTVMHRKVLTNGQLNADYA